MKSSALIQLNQWFPTLQHRNPNNWVNGSQISTTIPRKNVNLTQRIIAEAHPLKVIDDDYT